MFFLNSLKHSKIFVIQILYSYHKSSSIHTNVYHLSFVKIPNFLLITIFIPINKFKYPIGFQLFTAQNFPHLNTLKLHLPTTISTPFSHYQAYHVSPLPTSQVHSNLTNPLIWWQNQMQQPLKSVEFQYL